MSVVLCFVFSAILTQAQTADTKQAPPAKSVAANSATAAETEELKERRARARALLVSLSTDARTFHDQTLRPANSRSLESK